MRTKLFILAALITLVCTNTFAQNKYSFGIIGSRFENIGTDSRMSQINHPFGVGAIAGYSINDDITAAMTFEYFKGNMDAADGKESDYRAHLSAYYHPISFAGFRPYISGGLVYAYKVFDFNTATNTEENKSNLFGRFGFGVDYPVISNISANVDFGFTVSKYLRLKRASQYGRLHTHLPYFRSLPFFLSSFHLL
jgi:hypothetical protein